jgi:endoglucanase
MAVKLDNGAAIKIMDRGMITHPKMKKYLEDTAVKHNIKFQFEVLEFGGTDGMEIHVSRAGVPTGVLSIPTRYLHTPIETVSLRDVENVIELLVRAIEDYR